MVHRREELSIWCRCNWCHLLGTLSSENGSSRKLIVAKPIKIKQLQLRYSTDCLWSHPMCGWIYQQTHRQGILYLIYRLQLFYAILGERKEGKYMLFTCQYRVCLVARANLECLSLMIHDDPSQVELRYITCLAPTDVLSYAHMRCCLVPFMLRWACTISVLQIHPPYYQKGPQTKKEKSNRVHSIGASLPAANWGEAATIGGMAASSSHGRAEAADGQTRDAQEGERAGGRWGIMTGQVESLYLYEVG
jgi:hypothetical protein